MSGREVGHEKLRPGCGPGASCCPAPGARCVHTKSSRPHLTPGSYLAPGWRHPGATCVHSAPGGFPSRAENRLNLKNPSKIYAFFETSFLSIKIENHHLSSVLRERKSPLRARVTNMGLSLGPHNRVQGV